MERSARKKYLSKGLQILFPLLLGVMVFVWIYHGFDFSKVGKELSGEMDYGWMAFSLVFGVLAQVFRGWRWRLALEPLGAHPKSSNCVYAIYVSYAANLVIPRVGEVSRCGILNRFDNVSFAKSLGTVVTERMIDTVCIFLLTGITLLVQSSTFAAFFDLTGTNTSFISHLFNSTNFFITLLCLAALGLLVGVLIRNLSVYSRLKKIVSEIWEGCMSLRRVRRPWLFLLYTLGIWGCYFLHFYITFFAFPFTENLGIIAALVLFVVGSIAVIVPTPNGAGPWHFAVITMMMMYGISKGDAGVFALLVHGIQTFLLILLGIYGWVALSLTNKKQ